jgi:hypothetical protein
MTAKRDRRSTPRLPWREGWLTAYYGTHEGSTDLHFAAPRRSDSRVLYDAFCTKGYDADGNVTRPSLVEELEARGYDVTTLEFRIKRKVTP